MRSHKKRLLIFCYGHTPKIIFLCLISTAYVQFSSHDCSYRGRSLDLHGVGCVSAGGSGEAGALVAQHTADGADVHAALQGGGANIRTWLQTAPRAVPTAENVLLHLIVNRKDLTAFSTGFSVQICHNVVQYLKK